MSEQKSLVVEPNGRGLYRVKYTGGGETPKRLAGLYTSYATAKADITLFQSEVQASPDIKYPKPRKPREGSDSAESQA